MFNKHSVSIFTDASLRTENGITSVCPGYAVYIGDVLVEQNFFILHDATVNQGELYAILIGVCAASKYANIGKLRLFSDSQTSIFAIRDRVFGWIPYNPDDGLIGRDGKPISNQDYIMSIIYQVLMSNLNIHFFHVKGHVKYFDYYDLQHAKSVFARSNGIDDKIDDELIRQISICNDYIDQYTGIMLDMYITDLKYKKYPDAITIGYAPFDRGKYKELIGVD